MSKKFEIAGNWKMNMTPKEVKAFMEEYRELAPNAPNNVTICAPFTSIPALVKEARKSSIVVGAQNLHPAKNGTHTGEISADMLVAAKAKSVIIGHSERRAQFGETDEFINAKVQAALAAKLTSILCIGETLEEKEAGRTMEVLKKQFAGGLAGIKNGKNICIAYEPVWAISGGDPSKPKPIATPEQIEEVHTLIKNMCVSQFGSKRDIPVLYGGSANDKNMHEIFTIPNVDGALIGGASLVPEKFAAMANWRG